MNTRRHVVTHGTVNEYNNFGCRCPECREAWRVCHLTYMHAKPERLEKHKLRERARRERTAQSSSMLGESTS